MFRARITISLRSSILDVQGKAVQHALESLSMKEVGEVRIGKFIEMKLAAESKQAAEQLVEQACQRLLANPVMEDYSFIVEEM